MDRTGYSKDKITEAKRELEDAGYIKPIDALPRKKYGRFGSAEFCLLNPTDRSELKWAASRNLIHGAGLPYFLFPQAIITETAAFWSVARMGASQVRMYVAICWLANRSRGNLFTVEERRLSKTVGFRSKPTFVKALDRVQELGLVEVDADAEGVRIALCDPFTREPLHEKIARVDTRNDLASYRAVEKAGGSKRMNFNTADPAVAERLLLDSLPPDSPMKFQSNGDISILCPFHTDQNPSCSVSLKKQCFKCFGCSQKGTLRSLLMKLRNCSVEDIVKVEAKANGTAVEYRDPDFKALAKYDYYDPKSKFVKQVQRFRDEKTGKKRFTQWRPGRNGVRYYDDVPTMLYNLNQIKFASVVCITEGEKDADAVMNLNLHDVRGGEIVATTSGGSDTWQDTFADELTGKQVVILPDADENGQRYAKAIAQSLEKRSIEHRRVDFTEPGVKDVSDYLGAGYTPEQLVQKIGTDWLLLPGETRVDSMLREQAERARDLDVTL
jgi:5S rRNA maturation endonuclease (ribonuclease M5)